MAGNFIGYDPSGVAAWQGTLNSAHERVITELNNYKAVAQQSNEVVHGSHFESLNSQAEEITSKHLSDHEELHAEYTKASQNLVTGVEQVAGS